MEDRKGCISDMFYSVPALIYAPRTTLRPDAAQKVRFTLDTVASIEANKAKADQRRVDECIGLGSLQHVVDCRAEMVGGGEEEGANSIRFFPLDPSSAFRLALLRAHLGR